MNCEDCGGACCKYFTVGRDLALDVFELGVWPSTGKKATFKERKDAWKMLNWLVSAPGSTSINEVTCLKLKDGKCTVYNSRPNFCRLYDCKNDGRVS